MAHLDGCQPENIWQFDQDVNNGSHSEWNRIKDDTVIRNSIYINLRTAHQAYTPAMEARLYTDNQSDTPKERRPKGRRIGDNS
jgi:hypothetical protein